MNSYTNNNTNVATLHGQYHDTPEDNIIGYDWKGNEIYSCDTFIIINGDKVIDEIEMIVEYVRENGETIEGCNL